MVNLRGFCPKPEIAQLQGFYCIFNWQYFQFWSKISIFFFSVAKSRCWFDEADVEKFGRRKRKEGSRNAWKPCFEKKTRAFWLKALKIRWLFSLYKHKRSNLFLFFFLSKKTFKFTRFSSRRVGSTPTGFYNQPSRWCSTCWKS